MSRSMTVKNNQFTYAFNQSSNIILTGQVGSDGAVDGFAPSAGGGVRLSGKILGGAFVGQAIGTSSAGYSCTLDLHLQKVGQ